MTIPVFPVLTGRDWPIRRSPIWASIRHQSASGIESRMQQWSYPRYRYELRHALLRASASRPEWQTLLGFYNQVAIAPGQVFRYHDPSDGSVSNQPFGVGNGAATTFRLVRSLGGFAEPVLYPIGATIQVAGVTTGSVTVGTGGVVIFASAPASGASLTWSGTYDWLCGFDDDTAEFQQDMPAFWSQNGLRFTTIKV